MIVEIVLACAIIVILTKYLWNQRNFKNLQQHKLPPGPWGFPILGHLPLLGKNPSMKFLEWKKIYGPIFSVKFGSIPTVVLNDVKIIKDAFNQDRFSGRPPLNNWIEMTGSKGGTCAGLGFAGAGPRQVEQRKFTLISLREFVGVGKSAMEYRVEDEMSIFSNNLRNRFNKVSSSNSSHNTPMTSTFQVKNFFQIPVINAFWDAIMGQRFNENDPTLTNFVTDFETALDTTSSVVVNLSWFLPWVSKLLCFLGRNLVVSGMRKFYSQMGKFIEDRKSDYVPGHPKHFTDAYFDQIAITKNINSGFHVSRSEQEATTGDLFLGAIETGTITLDWLLLYLAREPEVQRKLLEEIDAVMGSSAENSNLETPSISHRTKMPFTEAIINEVSRIATLVPLGMFHTTLEDIPDFYGFAIPKNTMVISNLLGVHNDPEIWSEPHKFLPERFLNKISSDQTTSLTANLIPFGYGKRGCVGEGFARNELFLILTSFFQKFKISPTSVDNVPSDEGHFGTAFAPQPFEINITTR